MSKNYIYLRSCIQYVNVKWKEKVLWFAWNLPHSLTANPAQFELILAGLASPISWQFRNGFHIFLCSQPSCRLSVATNLSATWINIGVKVLNCQILRPPCVCGRIFWWIFLTIFRWFYRWFFWRFFWRFCWRFYGIFFDKITGNYVSKFSFCTSTTSSLAYLN